MRNSLIVPGAVAGLIAGIVMAMWAMIVASVLGAGLLAPPQMIAEPFFGPFQMGTFNPAAFIVGLMVHMMFSVAFGIIFVLIWQGIAQGGRVALLGRMIYGVLIWVVMSYVVGPILLLHGGFQRRGRLS